MNTVTISIKEYDSLRKLRDGFEKSSQLLWIFNSFKVDLDNYLIYTEKDALKELIEINHDLSKRVGELNKEVFALKERKKRRW